MPLTRRSLGALALAALGLVAVSPATQAAEAAFATPAEGIAQFVAALRGGDAPAAIGSFGIDQRVEGYSFVASGQWLSAVNLQQAAPPTRYPFYKEMARIQFTAEAARQINMLAYSLLAPKTPLDQTIVLRGDGAAAELEAMETTIDPARLAGLTLVDTALALPETAKSDAYRHNMEKRLAVTGGDAIEEWVALYELDGQSFASGFTFVRHGDQWSIQSLASPLAGLPANGAAVPSSAQEFKALSGG